MAATKPEMLNRVIEMMPIASMTQRNEIGLSNMAIAPCFLAKESNGVSCYCLIVIGSHKSKMLPLNGKYI